MAIELQIFRRINAGLLSFAQRIGTRSAKSDNQRFGPILLKSLKQVAAFLRSEIHDNNRGRILLQDGLEPIGVSNLPDYCVNAQKSFYPTRQVRVLGVENACGRSAHAATTP